MRIFQLFFFKQKCRSQTEPDPDRMIICPRIGAHADDQEHPEHRQKDTSDLLRSQGFLEDKRSQQRHENRLEIIAQCRIRYRRVTESLKQQDPVHAYRKTRQQQEFRIFPYQLQRNPFLAHQQSPPEEQTPQSTPEEGNLIGSQIDILNEDADRPEYQHRQHHFPFSFRHNPTPSLD